MRIRTIKPDFWKSEDIATLSSEAKLLALGLLNYADDEGYFNANHALIKSELFPLSEIKNLEKLLIELSQIGYIEVRKHQNGKSYGKVMKFEEHQRVNRPYASKIKELFEFTECSLNVHGAFMERSPQERKGREKEIEGKGENLFSAFYDAYPKKVSRLDAEKSYRSALKKETHDNIMAGLERYKRHIAESKTERRYIKNPSTWLNQGCWEDDYSNTNKKVLAWN